MYIYMELRLFPSTGILHLSINCLGKNPTNVLLSGITLPRVVPEPFIFRPCLPGRGLILVPYPRNGAYFRSPGPRIGAYFSSPGPRNGTCFTSLFPGRKALVAPSRILHPRLTRPWCVSPPTAGESNAAMFHRELARLACVPVSARGKLL